MRKAMKRMTFCVFTMTALLSTCNTMGNTLIDTIRYQCPMQCEGEKTYDRPGTCPVCKMDLEKINAPNAVTENAHKVKIAGAMLNVMHLGLLYGAIHLDTIATKAHLYGLGPVEYLKGEILIDDGHSYVSKVADDGTIAMEETYEVKAPFFVYEKVDKWEEVAVPDYIKTLPQLETFLDAMTKKHSRPFAFRLSANVEKAAIHVVNLPDGTPVNSPEDAHQHQQNYVLKNGEVELIGFFSTAHQGIFTHHDTYMHIHLITADKKKMGHLESVMMNSGAKLYLPVDN